MEVNSRSLGFIVSVDFGKLRDPTAFSVLEEVDQFRLEDSGFGDVRRLDVRKLLHVRHLQRMPLGMSYVDINRVAGNFFRALPERPRRPVLLCDATGVGRAPIDFMQRSGLRPIAITFTSGLEEREISSTEFHVPKKNMVSAMALLMQDSRLRIAPELPHATLLEEELRNFTLKVRDTGHEAFEAGRESIHDDLTFSVMMGAWWAERKRPVPAHNIRLNLMER